MVHGLIFTVHLVLKEGSRQVNGTCLGLQVGLWNLQVCWGGEVWDSYAGRVLGPFETQTLEASRAHRILTWGSMY